MNFQSYKELILDRKYVSYPIEKIIDIAEDIVVNNLNLHDGVIKYKFEFNRLARIVKLRKNKGSKLTIDDLKGIPWVGSLLYSEEALQANYADNITVTPHCILLVANDLTDQELEANTDKPRIIGRAKAFPRSYRSKKQMRNKYIESTKRRNEKCARNLDACSKIIETEKEEALSAICDLIKNAPPPNKLFKGYPASDYLDENGNYIKKRGRRPYINPLSEKFHELPEDIIKSSLERYKLDSCLEREALNALNNLSSNSSNDKYQVFLHLQQKFPDIPKNRILMACDLNPSHEKFLKESLNTEDKYQYVYECMAKIYKKHQGHIGRIRFAIELRKYGVYLCDQTVRKLMHRINLTNIDTNKKPTKYNSFKEENKTVPNELKRNFLASRPYEKIVSDVTLIQCSDKNLYVSPFIDLYTKEVIVSTFSDSPTADFVVTGLKVIVQEVNKQCLICYVHTDQGSQYQSFVYKESISQSPFIKQSMSRKGNCYDNGACESFFGTMKREVKFNASDSYETNLKKVIDYINFYNKNRVKESLQGMTPSQYRMQYYS